MLLEEVVRDMAISFKEEVGAANVRGFVDRVESLEKRHVFRLMANELMDEGMSGGLYVRFACGEGRRRRKRDPWPDEVFSLRSFSGSSAIGLPPTGPGLLADYRKSGFVAYSTPGYLATAERHRAHRERVEACRVT
jgi:hypothetical protein